MVRSMAGTLERGFHGAPNNNMFNLFRQQCLASARTTSTFGTQQVCSCDGEAENETDASLSGRRYASLLPALLQRKRTRRAHCAVRAAGLTAMPDRRATALRESHRYSNTAKYFWSGRLERRCVLVCVPSSMRGTGTDQYGTVRDTRATQRIVKGAFFFASRLSFGLDEDRRGVGRWAGRGRRWRWSRCSSRPRRRAPAPSRWTSRCSRAGPSAGGSRACSTA